MTDLPPGWTEQLDESRGARYYFNTETGETTWERPQPPPPAAPPPPAPPSSAPPPSASLPQSGSTSFRAPSFSQLVLGLSLIHI